MFITGLYVIEASASALNNGRGENNLGEVKSIRVQRHEYPYVSAQAFRYWLRETLSADPSWNAAPIYRGKGKQQSFTEGDPLTYWDDDLFGYMRAEAGEEVDGKAKKGSAITRIASFRTSTLVSAAPSEIVRDFGVMGRGEGDFVLHEHEFYQAALVGSFSIDLSAVGTFSYFDRSGLRNLDAAGRAKCETLGLEHVPEHSVYRLPVEARQRRVFSLLRALGRLEGGAKQTLHYSDVSPALVCMAVMRGGNNPFMHLMAPTAYPSLHAGALDEALTVFAEDYLSGIYVGIRQGFADSSRPLLAERGLTVVHPRQAFDLLADEVLIQAEWFA